MHIYIHIYSILCILNVYFFTSPLSRGRFALRFEGLKKQRRKEKRDAERANAEWEDQLLQKHALASEIDRRLSDMRYGI